MCRAGGRLSAQRLLRGQLGLCLQTQAAHRLFQGYSHGLGEHLAGRGGPVWGPVLALFQSLWLCLPRSCLPVPSWQPFLYRAQPAALQLPTRGRLVLPIPGSPPSSFGGF